MSDNHLRNIALFLMGMGFTRCAASKEDRIMWLRILGMEWERRLRSHSYGDKSLTRWRASVEEMKMIEENEYEVIT